jgi:hypothetical protein
MAWTELHLPLVSTLSAYALTLFVGKAFSQGAFKFASFAF